MILILSKKDSETSTEDVMDWLDYLGGNYYRLNGTDYFNEVDIRDNDFPEGSFLDSVNVVWFRRWIDESELINRTRDTNASNDNLIALYNHLQREIKTISNRLFDNLKNKQWLSHPENASINKLNVNKEAQNCGLKTAASIVTNKKSELLKFKRRYERVITKPLGEGSFFVNSNEYMTNKTVTLSEEFVNNLPEYFFPSLFQELIPKLYELRVFYFDGEFYPMAIFSQLDRQTEVDFRNYNKSKPNRTVPFIINNELKGKLTELMKRLDLKTGSIDIIRSTDEEYYFLEVNPVGQFGMTSAPCNYNLEKRFASYLIESDEN